MSERFPAIPDFSPDSPDSMAEAMRAMKNALEQLMGMRRGTSLGAPAVFVQSYAPTLAENIGIRTGSFWIHDEAKELYFWSGAEWEGPL